MLKLDYEPTESGIRSLAAAIILRAAEDYGNALLGNLIETERRSDHVSVEECEQFFKSDKFTQLCPFKSLSGEAIIKKIREDVATWPKDKRYVVTLY